MSCAERRRHRRGRRLLHSLTHPEAIDSVRAGDGIESRTDWIFELSVVRSILVRMPEPPEAEMTTTPSSSSTQRDHHTAVTWRTQCTTSDTSIGSIIATYPFPRGVILFCRDVNKSVVIRSTDRKRIPSRSLPRATGCGIVIDPTSAREHWSFLYYKLNELQKIEARSHAAQHVSVYGGKKAADGCGFAVATQADIPVGYRGNRATLSSAAAAGGFTPHRVTPRMWRTTTPR